MAAAVNSDVAEARARFRRTLRYTAHLAFAVLLAACSYWGGQLGEASMRYPWALLLSLGMVISFLAVMALGPRP